MVVLLWDASALAKRYAPEVGSDTVDALFAEVPTAQMVSSSISYAEIYSILLRKFNRAAIDRTAFETAKSSLRAELINDPDFVLLSIDDTAFYSGIALMEAHNLNATDAALLTIFQFYIQTFAPDSGLTFLLVAADERMVRTAQLEGLQAVTGNTARLWRILIPGVAIASVRLFTVSRASDERSPLFRNVVVCCILFRFFACQKSSRQSRAADFRTWRKTC